MRLSDVQSAAALHEAAFPAFFLSSLGRPFLVQFYRGYLADPTAVTVVAEADGDLVGCVVGTTEPAGYFKRLLKRQFFGFAAASARAALGDPRKVPRLLRAVAYRGGAAPETGGALLSSICVSPVAQGTGVGGRLLAGWEEMTRQSGADSAFLTTDADDNEAANAFYRRHGWHPGGDFRTREGRRMNTYIKTLERSAC